MCNVKSRVVHIVQKRKKKEENDYVIEIVNGPQMILKNVLMSSKYLFY